MPRSPPTCGSTPRARKRPSSTVDLPELEDHQRDYYGEAGPGAAGTVLTVDFVLDGQPYTAINGGPQFTFSEAISFVVNCADQDEVDYYWDEAAERR